MATTRRHMAGLSEKAVFDVLRDGHSYAGWVVGTRTIRSVEDGWPREGTRLRYSVGHGPLKHDDETRSRDYQPDRRLELEAKAWPLGTAKIVITAEPEEGGTQVAIEEHPHRGLARTLHNPVLDLLIKVRNGETLRRLEEHARGRG